ncbi:MAG: hypothetical protein KatS3mg033_1251 [Thermonema sp.]|uniref:FKBP-type peptidyl-prolyl cis-trans isomerase n=1 Tax=Thermonema sp. TaxID=2231181 RepID=UPI0021DCE211|nr:FKBP-type peptidyl-prolyl cis-trans isomerase [Thermonema sp.]GIV39451.1 MAG: hypothetical protein KatS3mg033_1251 [Thermonema sp.]
MLKHLYALLSAALFPALLISCDQSTSTVEELPSGVRYEILSQHPDSTAITDGSLVSFHLQVKGTTRSGNDTILQTTYPFNTPILYRPIVNPPKGSFLEPFLLLHKGDSARIWVPADSVVKQISMPEFPEYLKPGSDIEYTVTILDVKTPDYFKKQFEQMQQQQRAQVEQSERAQIREYLKKNGLKADSTENGLYYIKEVTTDGPLAQAGDVVSVYYSLQLLAKPDTLIESNKDAQPFEFVLGKGEVIKGWDEGIALFRKGEKGKLIVPSYLGYGARRMGEAIPPNSILIFDIEIVDIRKEKKIEKE